MKIKDLFFRALDYIAETVVLNREYYEQKTGEHDNTHNNKAEKVKSYRYPATISGDEYDLYRDDIDKHYKRKYDFESVGGINKIPVKLYTYPKKSSGPIGSYVGHIEYVLRMAAGVHSTNKRMDLAIACLRKAQDIMPLRGGWRENDYMRLVEYLLRDGQFDEARKEWDRIRNKERGLVTTSDILSNASRKRMQDILGSGEDLVQLSDHEPTCAECVKYCGRVYSISGNDKRFPKLPERILKSGNVHEGCRHTVFTYYDGSSSDTCERGDKKGMSVIRYSNRPFVDDRTEQEREAYEILLQRIRKSTPIYNEEWFEAEKEKAIDHRLYDTICEVLPDIAPKSFGGYRRMRAARSKNFIALAEKAKAAGLEIE